MTVAKWFLNKNYNMDDVYAMSTTDPKIERETEKAYLLVFKTDFGTIKGWFPKSVCTEEVITAPAENEKADVEIGEKVIIKTRAGNITGTVTAIDATTFSVDDGKKVRKFMQGIARIEKIA